MAKLIVNADDFGYSTLFNKRILELMTRGYVTSTTVMVNWIDEHQKDQVNTLISLAKKVSIGLHLEFLDNNYEAQIQPQWDKFVKIFKCKPSHMDIHKTHKDAYLIVSDFCKKKNIPCRNHGVLSTGTKSTIIKYFNGTKSDIATIQNWLRTLKDNEFYEILFHPGYYDHNSKSSLNKEREIDAEKIEKIISIVDKYTITLVNFNDLAAAYKNT